MSDLAQELAENHGWFDQGEFRYEDFKASINGALEWAARQAELEAVDAQDTQDESDFAYNQALWDAAKTIRAGKSV